MKSYFMYVRKSSESEDRQVLSIESQIKELSTLSNKLKLKLATKPFIESKSAKAPGRPVFTEMVARLQKGEADGIICWKLDRLARNPIDGGSIIWLTKDSGIEIVTPSQTFSQATDNTIIMYIEFGMAQKFIDDLGKNSKRGMRAKAEKGWYPAPAPIGYKNSPNTQKGLRTIDVDEIQFPLVRKAFEEVLAGKQPIEAWRSIKSKSLLLNKAGSPISRSSFYFMLTNPFYTGDFEWPKDSGTWYQGKHKPLITKEEFDIVQIMLGRKGRPIARSHIFELTGVMRCACCNCAITATKKIKYYGRTKRTAEYIYYHCSRKSNVVKCNQAPISQKDLREEFGDILLRIRLKPEFIAWAKKWLKVIHQQDADVEHKRLAQQNNALEHVERRLSSLLNMRLDEKIDSDTYDTKKKELDEEKSQLQLGIQKTGLTLDEQRIKIEDALDFAYAAYSKFNSGNRDEKREVITRLGSNLLLDNKKVRINLKKYLVVCSEQAKWKENYKSWVEPQEYAELLAKRPDLRPAIPIWLPR